MAIKILILRFSSIGDIVLTTPVIRCLKKQLGDSEIHFLTKKQFLPLVENNPYIDQTHFLSTKLNAQIDSLKKEKFDLVIDLHNNLRTKRIKLALGVKTFTFNKLNIQKWLMVNLKMDYLPKIHIVERYFEGLKKLGIRNDGLGLDFFIPGKDEVGPESLPLSHRSGFISYAIGGQHATKKMPVEKIIELCRRIDMPVVLLGGKEDADDGDRIEREAGTHVFNGCGKYNLNQSASLLRLSETVITHDTGLMHIAAALKKRIISIWGNTIPEFGMFPYFGDPAATGENLNCDQSLIFEVKGLKCRPCSKIGFKKCPMKHFKCMNEIDVEKVASSVSNSEISFSPPGSARSSF